MYDIKQAIVTEGKFDKVKLSSLFGAPVIETKGFGVFKSVETRELIRHFAVTKGIIILTDSDPAGMKIRAYINDFVKEGTVLNAYIPEVEGKEKRKSRPGAAGILGVEGIEDDILIKAVMSVAEPGAEASAEPVTTAELYEAGLIGRPGSAALRAGFLTEQGLPSGLSTKQMLSYLNAVPGPDGFRELLASLRARDEG